MKIYSMVIMGLILTGFLINPNSPNSEIMETSSKNISQLNSNDSLFAPGSEPKLISDQFAFTEGPASDRNGNVFFTDQPNDRIWKYDTDNNLTLFMEKTGRSNGMYFDRNGNLISCADENNELWCITPKKKVRVLVTGYNGERLNGPNDVWVHPNGDMYFTDPHYERPYWKKGLEFIKKQNVYFLPEGKKQPLIADDNLVQPNGIVGTPDGKILYVADIGDNKTYKYDIGADGKLQNRQLFCSKGSDGMTIDERGNLYLTGDGVTIFNPQGTQIAHIKLPAKWTANVCFSGKNRNVLFITASKGVYVMDMLVKGV